LQIYEIYAHERGDKFHKSHSGAVGEIEGGRVGWDLFVVNDRLWNLRQGNLFVIEAVRRTDKKLKFGSL
jgi:hypothetical protein